MTKQSLKEELKNIDSSKFQRLGDLLLSKEGYDVISCGNCDIKNNTRKGTPDSFFYDNNDNDIYFVEYTTTNGANLRKKIKDDIDKCIDKFRTSFELKNKHIFYFINSDNIDVSIIQKAKEICSNNSIAFEIFTFSKILSLIEKYKSVCIDIFNEQLISGALSIDDFTNLENNKKGVDYSYKFVNRLENEEKIKLSIDSNLITIITGNYGVGKSMLTINFFKKNNYNVFCFNYSNSYYLQYVKENFKSDEKIIIFIDDINDVGCFDKFLASLEEKELSNFSVVCTIRKYALSDLTKIISKYKFANSIIEIDLLSNDLIYKMLAKNSKIEQKELIKKIVSLSNGNARLAIMANQVVEREGVDKLIDTKSILIEYFQICSNDSIKKIVDKYDDILAMISFLKCIDKNNLLKHKEIFEFFNITKDTFLNSIQELKNLEIIGLYEDRVIQIEDQYMRDYMLENVFIIKKKFSLSEFISKLFCTYKREFKYFVEVISSVYYSEDDKDFIADEVANAWVKFESKPDLGEFIKIFYKFNIEKSLIFFQSKFKKNFSLYNDSIYAFNAIYCLDEDIEIIINLIIEYKNIDAFAILLECLDYNEIRNDAFEGIKIIGRKCESIFNDNFEDCKLKFVIEKYNTKRWFNDVIFTLLKIDLIDGYNAVSCLFGNIVSCLNQDKLCINDRNYLWGIASYLEDNSKYRFLEQYINGNGNFNEKTIIENDIEKINILLISIKTRNEIKEVIFKIKMIQLMNFYNINSSKLIILNERYLKDIEFIYKIERGFFEKDSYAMCIIKKMESKNLDAIKNIILLYDKLLKESNSFNYGIKNFISILVKNVDLIFLNNLSKNEFLRNVHYEIKGRILLACYERGFIKEVFEFLKIQKYDNEILEAKYYFFENLNKDDINNDLKTIFDIFLNHDLNNDYCNATRDIQTLYNYSKTKDDFMTKIKNLLLIKKNNQRKFYRWAESLFWGISPNAKQVVNDFYNSNMISTIEELILECLGLKNVSAYSYNLYIFEVCKFDKTYVGRIIDKLFEIQLPFDYYLLKDLWMKDDYFDLANIILSKVIASGKINIPNSIKRILLPNNNEKNSIKNFEEWLFKKIDDNFSNEKIIQILTELILSTKEDLIIKYYVYLVEKNIDIESFKKLLYFRISYIFIDCFNYTFLDEIKILNHICEKIPNGLEKLKYKDAIHDCIKGIKDDDKFYRINNKLNSFI